MIETIRRIQDGNPELLPVLWDLVFPYAHRAAANRHRQASGRNKSLDRHGCMVEDYENAAFLALSKAVAHYKPDKGAFLQYYSLWLKSEFDVAAGRRGSARNDPIHDSERLEDVVADGVELQEVIPADEDPEDVAVTNVFLDGLRQQLRDLVDELPLDEAEEILAAFFDGKSAQDRADDLAVTVDEIRRRRARGIEHLRGIMDRTRKGKHLQQYIDATTSWTTSVSLNEFRNTRTSSTEKIAIQREQRLQRLTGKTR